LTLNLNGGTPVTTNSSAATSPTNPNNPLASPKICNLPSLIPLVPTPVEKNVNKNESVTVTHFSDIHGGIVEKISVPVTTSSSVVENGQQKSPPKSEVTKTSTTISNNPFADEMITTTIISTATAAITSPSIKVSTNPFRSSFNSGEKVDDKSLKISFPIIATKNPFTDDSFDNGNEAQDDVDMNSERNLSSISSIKIENNERNVTTIEDTHPQLNGHTKEKEAKKVTSIFRVEDFSSSSSSPLNYNIFLLFF
jgi:hypothetical protein